MFVYIFSLLSHQAEWETVFSEVSLHVVSVKKSFYGSALFLCRCHSVTKQPLFLSVDSTDYKWVETLKVGVISGVCPVWFLFCFFLIF